MKGPRKERIPSHPCWPKEISAICNRVAWSWMIGLVDQTLKFSANLGFLWRDLSLPDAIFAAKAAGFDAVEVHWPYAEHIAEVRNALHQTGLSLLGLNTRPGDLARGEMGLCALPDRAAAARDSIDEAIAYGAQLGARNVHVMAGISQGTEAASTFAENLRYACQKAAAKDMIILIEALNPYDVPGYFLKTTTQAKSVIDAVNQPNLKLMFDCYHVARTEGETLARLIDLRPVIGHIQVAGVPDRRRPDQSVLNYDPIFKYLRDTGYDTPLGAEYKPYGNTDDTLGWLVRARSSRK